MCNKIDVLWNTNAPIRGKFQRWPSSNPKVKISKIYSSNIKVLSQGTCIWNSKALSLTIQNIRPKLKFLKSGSNLKVTKSKIMVPLESSCHKEHTYEIWKHNHLPFKIYGQFKSFWKMDQTSRSKNLVPIERSCHKEHTYKLRKPYHLLFKRYGQY
jgi:hypothetical protein